MTATSKHRRPPDTFDDSRLTNNSDVTHLYQAGFAGAGLVYARMVRSEVAAGAGGLKPRRPVHRPLVGRSPRRRCTLHAASCRFSRSRRQPQASIVCFMCVAARADRLGGCAAEEQRRRADKSHLAAGRIRSAAWVRGRARAGLARAVHADVLPAAVSLPKPEHVLQVRRESDARDHPVLLDPLVRQIEAPRHPRVSGSSLHANNIEPKLRLLRLPDRTGKMPLFCAMAGGKL